MSEGCVPCGVQTLCSEVSLGEFRASRALALFPKLVNKIVAARAANAHVSGRELLSQIQKPARVTSYLWASFVPH
jgi:hypothetical protein